LVMSAWGGPKRRVHGVLMGWFVASILGGVLMGFARTIPVWAVAAFFGVFFVPIINGSNQAIWQAKVPPDLQGKVFSIRRLIAWFVSPLAMLIAGPTADRVLEPAMRNPQSFLATSFGWLVGTGPGRGMALLFIIGGGLAALVGISGYAFRILRQVDSLLPDHDTLPNAPGTEDRMGRMQDLIEERTNWINQPDSPQRELALKAIESSISKLSLAEVDPPEAT
jgi:MFS family permease